MSHIKNIAIVGVAGSVGSHITEHLIKAGKFNITAITRQGSKSKAPEGVTTASVNYDEPTTLVEALKGQEALIITMAAGQQEAQKKLIEAAAKAEVKYIMPNEYGPDVTRRTDMGKESLLLAPIAESHELIEKLGVSSWIGLTCSFWYEFSLACSPQCYGFDIKNKTVTFFDEGETKINTSTWAQCGRALAALFSLPISGASPCLDDWKNKELHIQSFFLSQKDMFASILKVSGDKESDWTIKYEPAQERYAAGMAMMKSGQRMQGFQQCMYTRVFYKDGSGDYSSFLDNEKLGLPEESLEEATKRAIKMVEEEYNYMNRH